MPCGSYMLKDITGLPPLPDGPRKIPDNKLCFQETGTGKIAEIGKAFVQFIQEGGIPGGQLAVVRNGELLLNLTCGYQSLESKSPLEVTDRFFTNCSAGAIIGMIFMSMVDKGMVKVEDNPFEVLYGPGFLDSFGADLDPKWREVTMDKFGYGGVGNPNYGLIKKGCPDGEHDAETHMLFLNAGPQKLPGIANMRNKPGSTAYYGEGGDILLYVVQKLAGDEPLQNTCLHKCARENVFAPSMAPFGDVVPFWEIEKGWRNVRVYNGTKNMEWDQMWSSVPKTTGEEPFVLPMACLAALAGGMQYFMSKETISRMFDSPEPWVLPHAGFDRVYMGWESSLKDTGIALKGGGDTDRSFTIVSRTAEDVGIAIGISGAPSGGVEAVRLYQFIAEIKSALP